MIKKPKKLLVCLLACIYLLAQTASTLAVPIPTTTQVPIPTTNSRVVTELAIPQTSTNPLAYVPTWKQFKKNVAAQVVKSGLEAMGFKNLRIGGYNDPTIFCNLACDASVGSVNYTSDQLATLIVQGLFEGKSISPEMAGTIGTVVNGGSFEDITASTMDGQVAQIEQVLGLPGALGVSIAGGDIGRGLGGGSSDGTLGGGLAGGGLIDGALGGAFGNGTGTIGTGSILGALGGIQVPGSDNATFTFQATHGFVTGVVAMDPPNPLKGKGVLITATGIATPPPGGVVAFTGMNPAVANETYSAAGMYSKEFTISYTYTPPPVKGHPQPPQPGVLKVSTAFRVSEFSGMGTGAGGEYGGMAGGSLYDGGNVGNLDGGSLYISGNGGMGGGSLYIGGNTGGISGSSNLLNQGSGAGQSMIPSSAGGLGGGMMTAAAGALTGDVSLPFGNLVNGTSTPNINIAMNGLDKIGASFMSITDTFHNLLRGTNAPRTDVQVADGKTSVQSDKTPDEVRKENYGNMTSILKTSAQYLAAKGIKASDIPKLYDKDSAYTSPREAWDMNRLTRFMGSGYNI